MLRIYHYFKQFLFYSFLIIYILLLANALLFKEVSPLGLFEEGRTIIRALNLVPLQTVFGYFSGTNFNLWISLMNVAGNVILFIPMGMYLQIFKKNKKLLNSVALVGAISLAVEITQYILGIGHSDIDDFILNTIGGLIGALLYRILYVLLKDENKIKTAITFLFCLVGACFGIWYFVMVNILGYKVKIL